MQNVWKTSQTKERIPPMAPASSPEYCFLKDVRPPATTTTINKNKTQRLKIGILDFETSVGNSYKEFLMFKILLGLFFNTIK